MCLMVRVFPTLVFAHGLGVPYEMTDGDYKVILEQETPEVLAGDPTPYTITLRKQEGDELAEFETIFVRVTDENDKTVLATTLASDTIRQSSSLLTAALPSAGLYNFSLSFRLGSDSLAAADFPINVIPQDETDPAFMYVGVFAGGLIIGSVITKFAKPKHPVTKTDKKEVRS